MPYAELDAVTLHYRDTGAGQPTLLLVHGWGGDLRVWDPVGFAAHRTVAVDLRGHGRSSMPAAGYRPVDLADDLARLLARLGVGPVVAVGHSMGAQVVTALAVEHPALVTALVVIDPAYGADDEEARGFHDRLARLWAEGAPAALDPTVPLPPGVREQMLATPGPVLAACYAGLYTDPGAFGHRPATETYLRRRTHPVLCLRALAEPAGWEAALPAPPGSRVVVWPGTGHFLHLEHPDRTRRLIADWLRRLPQGGTP
ncbi:alpha/beta fold hydrolase [Micromonospora haikouensis]|uniref:alpha/beta fold hydrolase n=1 Tax=Micromonospora haikouensis TaxID=686309 RepID=UPI003D7416A2